MKTSASEVSAKANASEARVKADRPAGANIKVLYFAGLREAFATSGEEVALSPAVSTTGALRDHIASRGEPWGRLTQTRNLRCAVNQKMVDFEAAVKDGDEVAFFPPVTGG